MTERQYGDAGAHDGNHGCCCCRQNCNQRESTHLTPEYRDQYPNMNPKTILAGPCYRCLFPAAPRPQSCARCSDAGVLGVVPGIIGCLQVLQVFGLQLRPCRSLQC